jgi:hypothetical protein
MAIPNAGKEKERHEPGIKNTYSRPQAQATATAS